MGFMSVRTVASVCAVCALSVAAVAGEHPWKGKHVAFLGDSITDPNQRNEIYWQCLERDIGIVLHPNTLGHRRIARVMAERLRTLPPDFKSLSK